MFDNDLSRKDHEK